MQKTFNLVAEVSELRFASVARPICDRYDIVMTDEQLMTEGDIHAFGIEIVFTYLQKDGWVISSADPNADLRSEPQIIASKDGDLGFFVVRTAVYPARGRFEEGQEAFETLVRHAKAHGADCFFASVGIANSKGTSDEEMSHALKGASYDVAFGGLVRMDLASDQKPKPQNARPTPGVRT